MKQHGKKQEQYVYLFTQAKWFQTKATVAQLFGAFDTDIYTTDGIEQSRDSILDLVKIRRANIGRADDGTDDS